MSDADLVEKLRKHALPDPHDEREVLHAPLLRNSANRIERLEKEVSRLQAMVAKDKAFVDDEIPF